jgi:hypothetical protein
MTLVLAILSVAGTALAGALVALLLLRGDVQRAGRNAILAAAAYPLGALLVFAWMQGLAIVHVRASSWLAVLPIAAAAAAAAWAIVRRHDSSRWRSYGAALWGANHEGAERWLWRALVAWLALRFGMLALEALSRPPLPWEAWLHAAARGHVWHALRAPAEFVPEAQWWNGGAYLAALTTSSALTPALDAWTTFALGGFDDTVVHAGWPMFWLSQVLVAYGAMRTADARPLHALVAATLVGSLPLGNAHAALGGTSAFVLATCYLLTVVLAWRALRSHAIGEAALACLTAVAMFAAGGAVAAVWLATLVPLVAMRAPPALARRIVAGIVVAGAIAAIVLAQNRLFVPATWREIPSPGLAALLQHAFLLGNWHLLAYAAIACLALGVPAWREPRWLPLSGVVALAILATIVLCTSAIAFRLVAFGALAHATLVLAPVLALWTCAIAHAMWIGSAAGENAAAPATPPAAGAPLPDPATPT